MTRNDEHKVKLKLMNDYLFLDDKRCHKDAGHKEPGLQ